MVTRRPTWRVGDVLVRLASRESRDEADRRRMRTLAARRATLRIPPVPPVPAVFDPNLVHRSTLELRAATQVIHDYRQFIAEKGLTEEWRAWRLRRAGRRR